MDADSEAQQREGRRQGNKQSKKGTAQMGHSEGTGVCVLGGETCRLFLGYIALQDFSELTIKTAGGRKPVAELIIYV